MGELSSYSNATASQLDDNDEFVLNVDGVTKNITAKEVAQVYSDFTALSGTAWDGTNKVKTATANVTLTFSPGTNKLGQLIFIQDATGSRTLTIEGNSIAVTSAANSVSIVSYIYDALSSKYRFFIASSIFGITGSPPVADTTPPTIVSATATDVNLVVVVFSETVVPTVAGWSVNEAEIPATYTFGSVSGSGNTWTFTLASGSMTSGNTFTISYNPTTGNTLDTAGNELATVTNLSVTDSISLGGDVTPPVLSTATVENAAPSNIVLTYNEALDTGSTPATGDFTPSGGKTVTGVVVSGSTVTVTVNTPYANGDTITISYTPGTNKIRDVAANNAASLSSQAVTNNVASSATYIAMTSAVGAAAITESPTGTFTTASTGDGQGKATSVSLAASANGSIQQKYVSSANVGAIVGFKTTNVFGDYSTFTYGVFNSAGVWKKIEGGSIIILQSGGVDVPVSVNDIAMVERVSGNQFQVKINGVVPTDNGTFAATSTAQVYACLDISVVGNSVSEVKGIGLT